MGLWKLTKVCERKKNRVKAIVGKENSVREGVEETNRSQNGHLFKGIGEEDPKNHEGECGYEGGGISGIIWELWDGCYIICIAIEASSLNSYQILIVNFSSYQ